MEDLKRLFIESANRLNIEHLTNDITSEIFDYIILVNKENEVDYIPDNICYCFTDYGLNILSLHILDKLLSSIKHTVHTVSLADVIYSLCILGVNKDIANVLANTWIKRCHKIYIRIDDELKDIPKNLWLWIFDDREDLYKKLDTMRICFIGKGDDLFTRVNIKNKKENS